MIMDSTQLLFLFSSFLIVSSAVNVVSSKNLIHAALWLISTLFGVAILFAILEAGFLAVVQVVVYIGAIAIMFIFAVMLTRRENLESGSQVNKSWPFALLLVVVIAAAIGSLMLKWDGMNTLPVQIAEGYDSVASLGAALISPDAFVLPFEVASVLLLAALLGSVYVAMNKK
jgi:NADH-quinone oxidoreductase subunit J